MKLKIKIKEVEYKKSETLNLLYSDDILQMIENRIKHFVENRKNSNWLNCNSYF